MPPLRPPASSTVLNRSAWPVISVAAVVALCLALFALISPSGAALEPVSQTRADARAAAKAVGLFADIAPSQASVDSDRRSVEVGVKFKSKVAGKVTGAQVYKLAKGPGTTPRKASLWGPSGERLASAKLERLRGSGWIFVRFAEPVRIAANKTYTVSVFSPKGRYAVTENAFVEREVHGDLVVPGPKNGVYAYGTSSRFPRRSNESSNYWVDVKFRPSSSSTSTPSPTATPTTPAPTTPAPTQSGTPMYPTAAQAGVPEGWEPKVTHSGTYRISQAGAVVEDLRVNGSIVVDAPNVTLRRVEVIGGGIDNYSGPSCQNGLVIEDSTVRRSTSLTTDEGSPAIGTGGYTARRVEIDGLPEGFRVGGKTDGCGPVVIEGSFARVVRPDSCGDWHGDGIQGYGGAALTVRSTTLELVENGCGGTAAFFYPKDQGNTSVDIDGLLVRGGGYPFRLGTGGTVRNLAVVAGSWGYGAINVLCSSLSSWDARIVSLNAVGIASTVSNQPCNTNEGN